VNTLFAGDTLLIKNGTYVEEVDIRRSGTANAPITVQAYPGHKPIIDGEAGVNGLNTGLPEGDIAKTNPNNGAGYKYTGLFDITGSHIVVDGLEITRSMGRAMRIYSLPGQNISHVTLRNCHVHDNRAANVLFYGRKEGTNFSVRNVAVDGCDLSGSGNFYQGKRSPSVADWPGNLSFRSVENIVVRNSVIHENWGEAVLLDSNEGGSRVATIEDNIFYDNKGSVYLHAVSDVILQRNFVYRSSTDRARSNPFGPTEGIVVSSSESPQYEQFPSENIKILNNIVVGSGAGITMRGTAEKLPIRNVLIAHNTVVNASSAGILGAAVNKENIVFRNNLVVSYEGKSLVYDGGQTQNGWTYSNNLWSSRPSALNGPDDVIGDPMLRNPSGFPAAGEGDPVNYQLLAGSPAINAGYNLIEPKDDFFGNKRSAAPDIGAHEQGDG
jgi:hypothetical protein